MHYAVDFDFVVATQDGEMPTSLPTAQVLIKLGANQKIEDKNGLTPKQIISEHERMAELYDSLM